MTTAAGIVAIAVCLALPGLLVLEIVRPRVSPVGAMALAAGLSMTINHLLVATLVLLGIYQRPVLFALVGFQLVILTILVFSRRSRAVSFDPPGRTEVRLLEVPKLALAALLLGYAIWSYAAMAFLDFGEIFTSWDPIVVWNRWALDWAEGRFPRQVWEYPQVLPSLWSMIYLSVGTTDLQVFPKALAAWFPLVVLLVFADMVRTDGRLTGAVAAYAACELYIRAKAYAIAGLADAPVGAMGFLAFYAGWLSTRQQGVEADRLALLGAVIAGGAALTKQTGAYFSLLYPLFLWLIAPGQAWSRIWRSAALIVLVAAPWYAYRAAAVLLGGEVSAIPYLIHGVHGTRSYAERALDGVTLLSGWVSGTLLYAVLGLTAAALLSRLGRFIVLLIALPYLTLYCLFSAYDIRNALPAVPFVAWAMGLGATNLVALVPFKRLAPVLSPLRLSPGGLFEIRGARYHGLATIGVATVFVLMIGSAAIAWAGRWPDRTMLLADHNSRLRLIGSADLNKALLSIIATNPPKGRIVSNYQMLGYIPETKPYFLLSHLKSASEIAELLSSGNVSYIVYVTTLPDDVHAQFDRWTEEGRLIVRSGIPKTWQIFEVRHSGA